MKKLLNFIFWPALAGFSLAIAMLLSPALFELIPGLQKYRNAPMDGPEFSATASMSFSKAIKSALPAVVSINNQQLVNRPEYAGTATLSLNDIPIASRTFFKPEPGENTTLGSGVIISPDGYIITSYHVMFNPDLDIIRPEQDITVTLNDGRNIDARLISLDARNDLALLKVDASGLAYLPMANTSLLEAGDIVLAIGNPRNIGQSVSLGIVSALRRRSDSYIIQTDAAINPGNSGGALIDANGNLIGVNSTIVSESGGSEGISFAIPASDAMELLGNYLGAQKFERGNSGALGVSAQGIISLESPQMQGVLIEEVTSGSAADLSGIRPGDIIVAVNGEKLPYVNLKDTQRIQEESMNMLRAITDHPPGELIMLEIIRNDKAPPIKVPVILGIGEPKVFATDRLEDAEPYTEVMPSPDSIN